MGMGQGRNALRFSNSRRIGMQVRMLGSSKGFNPMDNEVFRHRLEVWDNVKKHKRKRETRVFEFENDIGEKQEISGDFVVPADLVWIAQSLHVNDPQERPLVAFVQATDGSKQSWLWDLYRPLNDLPVEFGSLKVDGCNFKTKEGQQVFWHSAAHVLGYALEMQYGPERAWLCDGPPLDASIDENGVVAAGMGGFFYDVEFEDKQQGIPASDLESIRKVMGKVSKKNPRFERLDIDECAAREMFKSNPRKLELIDKLVAANPSTQFSAYRCGNFIDLCRGPHLSSTLPIGKNLKVLKATATNGKEQRVHAIAFPEKSLLKSWEERTAEAALRDHRLIGKQQELFMFHQLSPGSAFMLPHGTLMFNRLVMMLRDQYEMRGYQEVMTPLIYESELWKKSGHLDNYSENMYKVSDIEEGETTKGEEDSMMGLKPMNCPGHCALYAHASKSFRELPVRFADFSALHRNELSGALGGMTRLRKFHQDDAHIFCTPDQIEAEILSCIEFVQYVYETLFRFEFTCSLSTRPESKSIGRDEDWATAEAALTKVLDTSGLKWKLDRGEGAFYGPKIDISVTDALGRQHQCATIQLDFQLPERFELSYVDSESNHCRPVMIHRAILGSVERFMAILMEHTAGKWPFWVSPRQIAIIPVRREKHLDYAARVAEMFRKACIPSERQNDPPFLQSQVAAGLSVLLDDSTKRLPKKVRDAQQAQYNIIVVVGDDEEKNNTVSVRSNDGLIMKTLSLEAAAAAVAEATALRTNTLFPLEQL